MQQTSVTVLSAGKLRLKLWNGAHADYRSTAYVAEPDNVYKVARATMKESSVTSVIILEAPLELLSIAIPLFVAGLISYLGLVLYECVQLGTGPQWGNKVVLIAFVVSTAFSPIMFGQTLGQNDTEMARCSRLEEEAGIDYSSLGVDLVKGSESCI